MVVKVICCFVYGSSQPSMVHWLISPIFPCSFVRPAIVTSSPRPLPPPSPFPPLPSLNLDAPVTLVSPVTLSPSSPLSPLSSCERGGRVYWSNHFFWHHLVGGAGVSKNSRNGLTSRENWSNQSFQGSRFNLAHLSGTICSCFSCCSI